MIFNIVNCEPSKYKDDHDRHLALCNLLASHGKRHNIVVSDKNTIEEIINCDLYVGSYLMFAYDIKDSLREYSSLLGKLAVHAEIDFSSKENSCQKINGNYIFKLSYINFSDPANSGAIDLLTENGNDFLFYNLITEYYSKHMSRERLQVKFNESLGAGSHCKPEFNRLKNQKKLLLCIIDNDKKHPQRKEGSTSSVFTKEDREYNGNNLAFVLKVREVESLIPSRTMEHVIVKKSKDNIVKLDNFLIFHKKHPDFKIYFDHKAGLSLREAIDLDNKYGQFWMNILAESKEMSHKQCFKDKVCTDCGSCPVVEGFGDSLLSHIISESRTENLIKFFNKIDDNIVEYWNEIGFTMMSWGCSGNSRVPRC